MAAPHPDLADAPLLRAARGLPADAGAGVVHAPGRPLAARVPGPPRRRAASSTPSATRTWPPRSRCSRSAATASTPPSSTPTSSCPSHAIGFGVDVAPGVGPVVDRAVRAPRPTSTASARSSPRPTRPTCSRRSATWSAELGDTPLIGFAGAPFTVASYLIEGRPVPHLRQHQGADARRPRACGATLLDRLADLAIASLRAQVDAGASAIQLFDSLGRRARPPTTTSATCCRPAPRCSPPSPTTGVPRIHFGVGTGELLAAHGRGRRRRGRRRLAGAARRRPRPRAAARPCRATSTRPCASPRGRSWPSAPATCCAATPATPATSSTSATACCPSSTPASSAEVVRPRPRRGPHRWLTTPTLGVVVMAYGTPASPDDVEAYYTHIRRGTPPTPEQLADLAARYDALGGISPLAARTEAQRAALAAALDDAGAGPLPRGARPEARRAVHRGRGRRRSPTTGVEPRRRPRPRPALLAVQRRRVPERACAAAAAERGIARRARSTAGTSSPTYLAFLAAAVRDGARPGCPSAPRCSSPPTRLPERVLVDDPYPDQLRASAAAVADAGRASTAGPGWALAWQTAGRTPEPWRGPDILEVHPRPGRHRAGRRRARVPAGLRDRPPRGGLRPRHRGAGGGRRGRPGLRPHPGAQRRPRGARRPRRPGPAPRHRRDERTDVVVVGGGITGLAAARDARPWRAPTVTVVEPGPPGGQAPHHAVRRRRARRGRRRLPRPGARGRRPVPRARARRRARLAGRSVAPTCGAGGALRLLPEAQVLGVPTDLDELAASGIVSPDGLERGAGATSREPLVAPDGDVAIGAVIRAPARRRGGRAPGRPARRRHQRRRHRPAEPGRHRAAARRRGPQRRARR